MPLINLLLVLLGAGASIITAMSSPVSKATSAGCFSYDVSSASNVSTKTSSNLKVEDCMSLCEGYSYFGVSNGNTCTCSDEVFFSTQNMNISSCLTPCAGNMFEFCGGPNHAFIFSNGLAATTSVSASTKPIGTKSTSSTSTSVSAQISHPKSSSSMTTSTKHSSSTTTHSSSVATHSSSVATHSSSVATHSSSVATHSSSTTSHSSSVNTPSSSTTSHSSSVTTHSSSATSHSSSVTTHSSSTTTHSTSTTHSVSTTTNSVSSAIAHPKRRDNWGLISRSAKLSLLGCWLFPATSTLMTFRPSNMDPTNLIVEDCQAACSSYLYFGMTGGTTCYCANNPNLIGATDVAPNLCALPCTGNQFEMCGNVGYILIYGPPLPVTTTTSSKTSSHFSSICVPSTVFAPSTITVTKSCTASSVVVLPTSSSCHAISTIIQTQTTAIVQTQTTAIIQTHTTTIIQTQTTSTIQIHTTTTIFQNSTTTVTITISPSPAPSSLSSSTSSSSTSSTKTTSLVATSSSVASLCPSQNLGRFSAGAQWLLQCGICYQSPATPDYGVFVNNFTDIDGCVGECAPFSTCAGVSFIPNLAPWSCLGFRNSVTIGNPTVGCDSMTLLPLSSLNVTSVTSNAPMLMPRSIASVSDNVDLCPSHNLTIFQTTANYQLNCGVCYPDAVNGVNVFSILAANMQACAGYCTQQSKIAGTSVATRCTAVSFLAFTSNGANCFGFVYTGTGQTTVTGCDSAILLDGLLG